MRITTQQLIQIIKEEVGREVKIDEVGGVAGNFGGKTSGLGSVAGRADPDDTPDRSIYGPEQTAEDNFVGILNDLGNMLDEWEQKEYPSDEVRYKSYFSDLQGLVEQFDPCAHVGQKCEEAHPNQSHEECIEVTINDSLYEKIEKRKGKFVVTSDDGAKTLGTHSSEAAAKRQLGAIHTSQEEED